MSTRPKAGSLIFESSPRSTSLVEHDRLPKTGLHPRVKPEGKLFRDLALPAKARQLELVLAGASDGVIVAGIGATHHAARRVVPQHQPKPLRRLRRAARDDNH